MLRTPNVNVILSNSLIVGGFLSLILSLNDTNTIEARFIMKIKKGKLLTHCLALSVAVEVSSSSMIGWQSDILMCINNQA